MKGGFNKLKNLYPIYSVYEYEEDKDVAYDSNFTSGNTLEHAGTKMAFAAYTIRDRIHMILKSYNINPNGNDEITYLIDPAHSGRKPHNMKRLVCMINNTIDYYEFHYEFEKLQLPEDITYKIEYFEDHVSFQLTVPIEFIGLSENNRVIGLNIFCSDHNRQQRYKWSGLPGDVADNGQGMGDLVFTRGLSQEQIDDLIKNTGLESNNYFTKWKKAKVPQELIQYVTNKKKGHTVRLSKQDCEIACDRGQNTEWGRDMKKKILEVADYWAQKSDRELFYTVPFGNPRAVTPGQYFGHPLYGGNRSAFLMCLERPYQYYHADTKTWLYEGVELKNPTTGESVVLKDDGSGFIAPEGFPNPGVRYMFTAAYRLFLLSMLMAKPYCPVLEDKTVEPETSGLQYAGAISNLAYAYILTNNTRYAYKAAILIGRIAELFPYMNGNYGDGSFSDTVHISEPSTTESHWLCNMFEAMDIIYDAIDSFEPKLQKFFATTPDATGQPRETDFCIKDAVTETIPYLIYSCELEKPRVSDWSMRYMYLELVLASYMQSGKLMYKTLFEGKYSLQSKLRNCYFRDGRYAYDSIGYIEHICTGMMLLPNTNFGFTDPEYFPEPINMFEEKSYGLYESILLYFQLKSGDLIAMFGDTHADNFEPISNLRKRGIIPYQPAMEIIYNRMPSAAGIVGPVLAQFSEQELHDFRMDCVKNTYLNHSLLLMANASSSAEYKAHSNNSVQPSFLSEDSEISVLRSGTDPHNTKHVILYGQPSAPHVHGDKLGLWIGAYGYHLLAAAGGYPFTWISPKINAWELHSAACIVVVIDGKNQNHSYSKQLWHYKGSFIQTAAMQNHAAYPGSHMERRCMLITAPDEINAFVLDIFACSNGNTFDYTTAGLDLKLDDIKFEGLQPNEWIPMKGTVAGEDVELYSRPGQGWMKAVKKIKTNGPFTFGYQYRNAGLRIHAISAGVERELIVAEGERGGEEMRKSKWVPYVLWRDFSQNADNHYASFITVMEPYEDSPYLQSVSKLRILSMGDQTSYQPAAVNIKYYDGHRDIIIATNDNGIIHVQDENGQDFITDAKALMLRYFGDKLIKVEAFGYTCIQAGTYQRKVQTEAYTGKIVSLDLDRRIISIKLDESWDIPTDELVGHTAVFNSPDYEKPAVYTIHQPRIEGNILSFTSAMSLIKIDADWKSREKRLGLGKKQIQTVEGRQVYIDLKPGDSFRLYRHFVEVFDVDDQIMNE